MPVELTLQIGDVTQVPSDVLLLKYAQGFYGADAQVASALTDRGICGESRIQPEPWQAKIVDTRGVIAPSRVMFLGTPPLGGFRYREMQRFAREAIEVLRKSGTPVRTLTATVHGAGYGLDAVESLQAMVRGFQQALAEKPLESLARITFVELNHRRGGILSKALADLPARTIAEPASGKALAAPSMPSAPPEKKRVFVAMPISEEFEDVYQFGIYDVVRRCGYVCERVDEKAVVGSIVDQIEESIRSAEIIVADLTAEPPNVYLEVGFAWGLKRKVLLLAREGTKLHFDLSHHKCVFYRTIGRLAEDLERTIRKLATPQQS